MAKIVETQVYVDLPSSLGMEQISSFLGAFFSAAGSVKYINPVTSHDPETNVLRNYAIIEFDSMESVRNAIRELNYMKFNGVPICVIQNDRETVEIIKEGMINGTGHLVIKNLEPSIEASQIHSAFAEFGDVVYAKIIRDSDAGDDDPNIGRVQFRNASDAADAMLSLQNALFNGLPVEISVYEGNENWIPITDTAHPGIKTLWSSNEVQSGAVQDVATCEGIDDTQVYIDLPSSLKMEETGLWFPGLFEELGFMKDFVCATAWVPETGVWHNYAVIEFDSMESVRNVIRELNYMKFDGVSICVIQNDRETVEIIKEGMIKGTGHLVIKNLEPNIEASQLHSAFAEFGDVVYAKIIRDSDAGDDDPNIGRVQFRNASDAADAMLSLQNALFEDLPVEISVYEGNENWIPITDTAHPGIKTLWSKHNRGSTMDPFVPACGGFDYTNIDTFPLEEYPFNDTFQPREIDMPDCVDASVFFRSDLGECEGFEYSNLRCITFSHEACVKYFKYRAFKWCVGLRQIEIPVSVEEIGRECFDECSSLCCVAFATPSSLKKIGARAFFHCTSLREIDIPASVEVMCGECFSDCISLSRLTFAKGSCLRKIGMRAFFNCTSLKEVEIPASVEDIGQSCFRCCASLASVTYERGSCLKSLGIGVFACCRQLKVIVIPASVEFMDFLCIGDWKLRRSRGIIPILVNEKELLRDLLAVTEWTLRNYRQELFPEYEFSRMMITALDLHDHCTRVVFESQSNLKTLGCGSMACLWLPSLVIPASVEHIDDACFKCCRLDEVTFEPGSRLKKLGGCFSEVMIGSIVIPASVEALCNTFCSYYNYGCNCLRKVRFESGSRLKLICGYAFADQWSADIEIPAGVKISSDVFASSGEQNVWERGPKRLVYGGKLVGGGRAALWSQSQSRYVIRRKDKIGNIVCHAGFREDGKIYYLPWEEHIEDERHVKYLDDRKPYDEENEEYTDNSVLEAE